VLNLMLLTLTAHAASFVIHDDLGWIIYDWEHNTVWLPAFATEAEARAARLPPPPQPRERLAWRPDAGPPDPAQLTDLQRRTMSCSSLGPIIRSRGGTRAADVGGDRYQRVGAEWVQEHEQSGQTSPRFLVPAATSPCDFEGLTWSYPDPCDEHPHLAALGYLPSESSVRWWAAVPADCQVALTRCDATGLRHLELLDKDPEHPVFGARFSDGREVIVRATPFGACPRTEALRLVDAWLAAHPAAP
jgi:hypothetical protein